jgi:hypothetical protein
MKVQRKTSRVTLIPILDSPFIFATMPSKSRSFELSFGHSTMQALHHRKIHTNARTGFP